MMKKNALRKLISFAMLTALTTTVASYSTSSCMALPQKQIFNKIEFERFAGTTGFVSVTLAEDSHFTERSTLTVADADGNTYETALWIDQPGQDELDWRTITFSAKGLRHDKEYAFTITHVALSDSGKMQTISAPFRSSSTAKTRFTYRDIALHSRSDGNLQDAVSSFSTLR